jgi:hypothetical protein
MKVCASKSPTFFSRKPLFSIARVRFFDSGLHFNLMVHFIEEHFMLCNENNCKQCKWKTIAGEGLNVNFIN